MSKLVKMSARRRNSSRSQKSIQGDQVKNKGKMTGSFNQDIDVNDNVVTMRETNGDVQSDEKRNGSCDQQKNVQSNEKTCNHQESLLDQCVKRRIFIERFTDLNELVLTNQENQEKVNEELKHEINVILGATTKLAKISKKNCEEVMINLEAKFRQELDRQKRESQEKIEELEEKIKILEGKPVSTCNCLEKLMELDERIKILEGQPKLNDDCSQQFQERLNSVEMKFESTEHFERSKQWDTLKKFKEFQIEQKKLEDKINNLQLEINKFDSNIGHVNAMFKSTERGSLDIRGQKYCWRGNRIPEKRKDYGALNEEYWPPVWKGNKDSHKRENVEYNLSNCRRRRQFQTPCSFTEADVRQVKMKIQTFYPHSFLSCRSRNPEYYPNTDFQNFPPYRRNDQSFQYSQLQNLKYSHFNKNYLNKRENLKNSRWSSSSGYSSSNSAESSEEQKNNNKIKVWLKSTTRRGRFI